MGCRHFEPHLVQCSVSLGSWRRCTTVSSHRGVVQRPSVIIFVSNQGCRTNSGSAKVGFLGAPSSPTQNSPSPWTHSALLKKKDSRKKRKNGISRRKKKKTPHRTLALRTYLLNAEETSERKENNLLR